MTGRLQLGFSLAAVLTLSAPSAFPATPARLLGSIAGLVRDSNGVPQMGASVLLFNRYERLIQRTLTNDRGLFGFEALAPDSYSVRVSLASFVPAVKQKIAVQPGMQSLLYVDLASVLSSIELVYVAPGQGALMSDDWKWTLKASAATRPILRALPGTSESDPTQRVKPAGSTIFSDTRGVFSVSAGDPGSLGASTQADLGTAFAIATSVFGHNQVQVSGNVGYTSGIPAAGFRTSYSRDGCGPEVTVTMRQIYLPGRGGLPFLPGQPEGNPALRSMSVSMRDSVQLTDALHMDYGASLDSVTFLDRLNALSKFARFSYSLGNKGTVQFAYSSGAPPVQLYPGDSLYLPPVRGDASGLAGDLAALSVLPRLSLLNGRTAIERSQNFELGYEKKIKSTTVDLTGFRETVANAAMTIMAPDDFFAPGEVLPDISSQSSVLDAGSFQRYGYAASMSQTFGDKLEVGASAGRAGALATGGQDLTVPTADDIRAHIRTTQRFWASARASATIPLTGTQISGSYEWMDYANAVMPDHFYMTQRNYPEPGLNLRLRQPIPTFLGMPGRLEATAELRNMLAQGYLPISEGGQRVLLIQSPRAVRGGLSFIF